MMNPKDYTTHFVSSKDGTIIGYRQLGVGPGLILVHGAMMTSQNFMKLARILSDEFTVYIPDRRGRGLSGPHGSNYCLTKESEDIGAIINQTKSENIYGLSSGAIVTLQTVISNATIKKVALYEPPIPIGENSHRAWVQDYELAISNGNLGKAFICIVKGTADLSLMTILPGFITIPLMNFAMKGQAKKVNQDTVTLKALIPTFHYDYIVVTESEGIIERCKDLKAELLLLGGTKSRQYLKIALDQLNAALPKVKRIEFNGLGHIASDNSGKPEVVARELRLFFGKGNA